MVLFLLRGMWMFLARLVLTGVSHRYGNTGVELGVFLLDGVRINSTPYQTEQRIYKIKSQWIIFCKQFFRVMFLVYFNSLHCIDDVTSDDTRKPLHDSRTYPRAKPLCFGSQHRNMQSHHDYASFCLAKHDVYSVLSREGGLNVNVGHIVYTMNYFIQ